MHNPHHDIDPPTPRDYRGVNYLPLPHVIREQTAKIRAGWSEKERRKRESSLFRPDARDASQEDPPQGNPPMMFQIRASPR